MSPDKEFQDRDELIEACQFSSYNSGLHHQDHLDYHQIHAVDCRDFLELLEAHL